MSRTLDGYRFKIERHFTLREAESITGIRAELLRDWVSCGLVAGVRFGVGARGPWRISEGELARFIRTRVEETADQSSYDVEENAAARLGIRNERNARKKVKALERQLAAARAVLEKETPPRRKQKRSPPPRTPSSTTTVTEAAAAYSSPADASALEACGKVQATVRDAVTTATGLPKKNGHAIHLVEQHVEVPR